MKVLGVGLSRTGTSSLHRAFQILKFKSIHYDRVRLVDVYDGSNTRPNFRRYDDVDALTDIPTAYFYRELLEAYPDAKAILTVRHVDSWWESTLRKYALDPAVRPTLSQRMRALVDPAMAARLETQRFKMNVRNVIFGSAVPREFLYKRKFLEYYERVVKDIPAHRLLVMNIIEGDGWELLCPFLGVPIPSEPFPHENTIKALSATAPSQGAGRHRVA